MVRLLLDNGASVNHTRNTGATPLFVACQDGHESTARLLLGEGATVDLARNDGCTPLVAACGNGQRGPNNLLSGSDLAKGGLRLG